jgi:hypothetical protein
MASEIAQTEIGKIVTVITYSVKLKIWLHVAMDPISSATRAHQVALICEEQRVVTATMNLGDMLLATDIASDGHPNELVEVTNSGLPCDLLDLLLVES